MAVFVANSNLLELIGFKSKVDGTPINNAVVTGTLVDNSGTEVAGVVWPVALDYVVGSDGDYRAVVPATAQLTDDQFFTAIVDADGGADRDGHWEFQFRAQTRRAS